MKTKLNLGAGEDIQTGDEWINHDLLDLPGIQVVHNLVFTPYPFEDESFDYILAKDCLEHLPPYGPDWKPMITAFMEQMYRILKPGGTLFIQTPSIYAEFGFIDPSHVRLFHPRSMEFYDKSSEFGKSTGFYSKVDFQVTAVLTENKNLQFSMVKRP